MTWLTRGVLEAERDRATAERERTAAEARADIEERTRLALWRMDALGAAIMLRENRNPADHYQVEDPAGGNPEVRLHFQILKGGATSSPELDQCAAGDAGPLAERLRGLRALLAANPLPGDEWTLLLNAANQGEVSWNALPRNAPLEQGRNILLRQNKTGGELRQDETYQIDSNASERAQRAKAVAQTVDNGSPNQALNSPAQQQPAAAAAPPLASQPGPPRSGLADAGPAVEGMTKYQKTADVGQMRAVWVGGELFLLRQVIWNLVAVGTNAVTGTLSSVQGVWLDARVLKEQLLHEVVDLLPHAKLIPVDGKPAAQDPLAMVSFPLRLERNETIAAAAMPRSSSFGAPLWVAWAAVMLAVLTSSLLVRGVMRLSERRASFVSAVTHELRTPLTTFRLYSEMLESGAVKEEKRGAYLRVLSREADRLAHLVENVLAFSRIERGNARSNVREVAAGDLLEQSRERLEARLATAGLALELATACAGRVRVDTAAVEHILFNLIDNAAKYAANSDPPVVAIRVRGAGRNLEIVVSDHGPGIPPSERGRIFQAFHKSAREAAESQPGVGLGLALSRRLAQAQGGELECAASGQGACFILRLPAA